MKKSLSTEWRMSAWRAEVEVWFMRVGSISAVEGSVWLDVISCRGEAGVAVSGGGWVAESKK